MQIVLLDEARRRFEAEDDWWRAHREATELFVDEFAEVLERLRSMPGAGQRCHVYYFHDRERGLIEIHSIWGARRERGPRL